MKFIDKTARILDAGDPRLAVRRRREQAARDKLRVLQAERSARGGHLPCEVPAPWCCAEPFL